MIVQNRCIETWFLGNDVAFAGAPTGEPLRSYVGFHDVRQRDPEAMSRFPGFDSHASFHLTYLKAFAADKGWTYSKRRPGKVLDKSFLEQLVSRTRARPDQLATFQEFLRLCRNDAAAT